MASSNLWNNAKKNRQYPELEIGNEVRVIQKKENNTKGYMPKWSKEVYKVTCIKDSDYTIHDGKRKLYQRHELLKVSILPME